MESFLCICRSTGFCIVLAKVYGDIGVFPFRYFSPSKDGVLHRDNSHYEPNI